MNEYSTCCSAHRWGHTDLCSECFEHTEFENGEIGE